MELREQFTLASGVSQSMTAFKAKPSRTEGSPNSSVSGGQSGQRGSISGPITKVRISKNPHKWILSEQIRVFKFSKNFVNLAYEILEELMPIFQSIREGKGTPSGNNVTKCKLHNYDGVTLSQRGCTLFPFQKYEAVIEWKTLINRFFERKIRPKPGQKFTN